MVVSSSLYLPVSVCLVFELVCVCVSVFVLRGQSPSAVICPTVCLSLLTIHYRGYVLPLQTVCLSLLTTHYRVYVLPCRLCVCLY